MIPQSRAEYYMDSMLNNSGCPDYPERTRTRRENYLHGLCNMASEIKEKIEALATGMNYKGSVADYAHLPSGASKGDVYTTADDGAMYVWDGSDWIEIGKNTGAVSSVNGKTGAVVLKAEDIKVKNTLSIQANLERIDSEAERLEDDKQDKLTAGTGITIENNVISATGAVSPESLEDLIDGEDDIKVDLNSANDTLVIGTHAKTVTITGVPATATEGTFSEQQLAALEESRRSIIIFNNEIFYLNDNGHEAGIRGYSHIGVENGVFMLKNITVTLNTRGWVLTVKELN